jgi:uncharacterized protein YdhG (YjbR/CyaY superfamily)
MPPPEETKMPAPASVDAYLASLPDAQRPVMADLRRTINEAAPEAVETIAYGMPALRSHGGQFLVSYAAFKAHYSLFPANDAIVDALGDEIRPYLAGKGTIRFPASRPIPLATVAKVVRIRLEENAAHGRR